MNFSSNLRNSLLAIVFLLAIGANSYGTHLRAGEIIVERVSCNSLTFKITVTVFTNTLNTNVLFGGTDDYLDFGDGSDPDGDGIPGILVPETQNIQRNDLGEGVATASFTVFHTFPGYQQYIVSYSEPNRNAGVQNMDASVTTRFYIETKIIVDPYLGCNNTPQLLVPPIDKACTGVAWFHNPGAYDPDGDSLSYEMVTPFRDKGTPVNNYKLPNDTKFGGTSETGGAPTFSINPIDGTITWDSPGLKGEYNIAFHIIEWRFVLGEWRQMGYVRRDMQIIVDECDNERPDLEIPEDVCVVAGTTLEATIYGTDPDGDDVKIEAYSEILNLAPAQSPATVFPDPAEFRSTVPSKAELKFTWNTECLHVKEQPYAVVFKITDNSQGTRLITFKTWFIRVVGPEPEWVSAALVPGTRSARLDWDPYACQNADSIQVWRRVDSFVFEPDSCQTGMPEFLGYEKIATVGVKTASNVPITSFVDNNSGYGLASGAKYCYRLVATFPLPRGGESYVSDEFCIGPIIADKAIITNVTVDKTDPSNGQITVRWLAPFEADPGQFPPPYTYDVFRAEGFAGDAGLTKITPTRIASLNVTDAGMDSQIKPFNYRVLAYASNGAPLDTSATASTVRLEAKSQLNKIQLTWSAFVPWSNMRQLTPNKHRIYRGPEGATDDQLVLIDSVDVMANGFVYVDGLKEPLVTNQTYCYKVMTQGGYGNPQINEPLRNFSQKVCARPGDEDAPCAPAAPIAVNALDCDDPLVAASLCNIKSFENILKWNRPEDPECRLDVAFYRVYAAADMASTDYVLVGETSDTTFTYSAISSFATCYKITAVDRSNNESELSESLCFDNCPYYELPNVFTPNADQLNCNNTFRAFGSKAHYYTGGEEPEPICDAVVDESRCARFVSAVNFRVFNRWGKEVYAYQSGGERTIYIDWDGRAADGSDLATGIYYWVADVTYVTVDPSKRIKTLKGWVHLIR
jgi:hypothetical protein